MFKLLLKHNSCVQMVSPSGPRVTPWVSLGSHYDDLPRFVSDNYMTYIMDAWFTQSVVPVGKSPMAGWDHIDDWKGTSGEDPAQLWGRG